MKKLILSLPFMFAGFAHANVLECVSSDGNKASLQIKDQSIVVGDVDNEAAYFGSKQELALDKTYKPRAQNKGSQRYPGGNNGFCDYDVILTKNLLATGQGRLVFRTDCDSDGTGPTYINFNCN